VFITGASGQTGLHVLTYFSKHQEKFEIHAGVHSDENQENQENIIKQCCPSAKVCPIDADDLNTVVEAFRGIDYVYVIPSSGEAKVHHGRCYVRAAKRANVEFVLLLSMIGAEDRNYLFANQFRDIENQLEQEKISFCVIRSNFYMQNLLLYKEQIKEGKLPLPIGPGKFAPIDVDDVGQVAKDIFLNCEKHKNKYYNITGPESLTGEQMANVFSKVLGRPIKWENISCQEAKTILLASNVPASDVQGLLEFYQLVAAHCFADVSKDFSLITSDVGNTLEDFFKRHVNQLKA